MICNNGKQITPNGETGIFFICHHESNNGNVCQFVKWCTKLNCFESSTNSKGQTCPNFEIKK
jgi:hypothetical protein